MATIKEKPFLRNLEDKPLVAQKLVEIGNLLRPLGLGTPLPATMNYGNEILPVFRMYKTAGNAITKQHLRTITDSFTTLTRPDIHKHETLCTPIIVQDINFKKLTPANVDRFLTHVTNMLEQASAMDIETKAPQYVGGELCPHGLDRLAYAWQQSVRKPHDTKPSVKFMFQDTQIKDLCKLVAECHQIIGTESISPVIQHHIAKLPERKNDFLLIEEDKPVALLTGPDTTEPFIPPVEQFSAPRQQAAEIPAFAEGTSEHLAFRNN